MIPLISRALLSWRQLCAMYLAHVRSFKAELMLDDEIPVGAKLY